MSFPILTGTTTYSATGLSTTWTPFSAETVAVGELLVFVLSYHSGSEMVSTSSPGWSVATQVAGSNDSIAIFTRIATGTSESLAITATGNMGSAAAVLDRYTGADTVAGTAQSHIASANPDPPSLSIGSSRNATWLAFEAPGNGGALVTSGPSGYGTPTTIQSGTNSNDSAVNLARNNVTAASEDPGVFTYALQHGGIVGTAAVYKFRKGVRFAWAA